MSDQGRKPLTPQETKLFDLLAVTADSNLPCPTVEELATKGLHNNMVTRLRRKGYIKVTLYDNNARSVEIQVGDHQGKTTKIPDGNLNVRKVYEFDPGETGEFKKPDALSLPAWAAID